MSNFHPYVAADKNLAEFTFKSILAGIVFGVIFGCANAYLGLRVGLTISTSIPIAVISIAFFRFSQRLLGSSTILENNMSQTVGSASSSMATGLIFTIPALFMWGLKPSLMQITLLAMLGSWLGILVMIPLRQFLIVNEHETLPYPEGTACAEVLKAADGGGEQAKHVFAGLGIGALYKGAVSFLKLWPESVHTAIAFIPKSQLSLEASPALLGVGYIVGKRIGFVMVLGGLIASVLLIPLLATFGDTHLSFLRPTPDFVFANLTADAIWSKCIRYVGAGAVTFAGIMAVIRAIPTMKSAFMAGLQALGNKSDIMEQQRPRTELDLPFSWVVIGVVVVLTLLALLPPIIGSSQYPITLPVRFLSTLCVALFSFLFVTVSSRVVGLVGVSSNPTSAMTIVSLLGTTLVFLLLGMTDMAAKAAILTIGTLVCVAASKAGDISQDLKAGYLVGATPRRQQQGQLIGAACAAFFVASAVYLLGETYSFGSKEIPAPQATLMKTVIEGVLSASLPWGLIILGAAIAALGQFVLKIPALPFAVGLYIPLSTNATIFLGGWLRDWMQKRFHAGKKLEDSEPGSLIAAGLIAGEGILGVLIAIYAFVSNQRPQGIGLHMGELAGSLLALISLAAVAYAIIRSAQVRRQS